MIQLRRPYLRQLLSSIFLLALCALFGGRAVSQVNTPVPMHDGVGVDEKSGETIDLSLSFINEAGQIVPLQRYFEDGKPVLLNLAYYRCPMLCSLVLNGQADAMRKMPLRPGVDYTVVTISIDPTETADLAREKRATYLSGFDRPITGWNFLVDHNGNAKRLAEQVGFNYKYDERIEQYSHASVIMVLSPQGKVARYLYGIQFKPLDVRLAITEAREEQFRFSAEQLLLLCYHFDPKAGSYVMFAMNFMRAGGVLVVLLIAAMILRLRRMEKARGTLSNQELVGLQ